MRRLLLLITLTGCLDADAASNGITTLQTKTAAPNQLNLSITSPTEGTSLAHARADHVHGVTGTLAETNGGTGAGALNCPNQFTTSNGTLLSCLAPTLAGPQFANQGTTTTLLHGNAAGNPSWAQVNLATEVTGTLPANSNNVQHDATLTGTGTTGSNLGFNLTNANTWTAQQTFSSATANQTSAICTGNGTGNGANFTGGASGSSGTGTNAYGINVTGGSASGAGIPGPGINTAGGQGAAGGAPGIVAKAGASNGVNVSAAQAISATGTDATGNAAGTTGGTGGPLLLGTAGAGGGTATGTGGTGGTAVNVTGGNGGPASGAGTGGDGGRGAVFAGGTGGTSASGTGGTGGNGLGASGGAGSNNGGGGDGFVASGGNGNGTGPNGDGISASSGSGGTGTSRGYGIRIAQNNTIKAHTNKNPLASIPSSLSNGDEWISGATTAMTPYARLNGATQPYLTGGVNGVRAVQAFRAGSVCTTSASAGASCNTTVTLPTAYPDANYTAVCVGLTGVNVPVPSGVSSVTASTFAFSIVAVTAAAATFNSLECITIHD